MLGLDQQQKWERLAEGEGREGGWVHRWRLWVNPSVQSDAIFLSVDRVSEASVSPSRELSSNRGCFNGRRSSRR